MLEITPRLNWSHIRILGVLIFDFHAENIVVVSYWWYGTLVYLHNLFGILALKIENHFVLARRHCRTSGCGMDFRRVHAQKRDLLSRYLVVLELAVVENCVLIMGLVDVFLAETRTSSSECVQIDLGFYSTTVASTGKTMRIQLGLWRE